MATGTNLEIDVQTFRLRAVAERRAGNTTEANAWDAEADALVERIVALEQRHA